MRTVSYLQNNETYYWRVRAHSAYGWGPFSEVWSFSVLITGVNEEKDIPTEFFLSQNYPNPFNPTTSIEFSLPSQGRGGQPASGLAGVRSVTLKIYDLLGREVAILVNENLAPGAYKSEWDGSGFPSGLYFYRLSTNGFVQTKKLILLR